MSRPDAGVARGARWTRVRAGSTALLVLGALAYVALVLLSRALWIGEVAASFRPLVATALAAVAVAAWLLRLRLAAGVVLASALLAAEPWLGPRAGPDADRSGSAPAPITVATANLYFENREFDAVLAWIDRESPDVLALQEIPAAWRGRFDAELARRYPHGLVEPALDDPRSAREFALALYARLPTAALRVVATGRALEAAIDWSDARVVVRAVHAVAPVTDALRRERNAFLAHLGSGLEWTPASLLLGDLNTSGGSGAWSDLARASGLVDARRGLDWVPTWRTGSRRIPRLPVDLDHVLAGPALVVDARRAVAIPGSDHRALLARVRRARRDPG